MSMLSFFICDLYRHILLVVNFPDWLLIWLQTTYLFFFWQIIGCSSVFWTFSNDQILNQYSNYAYCVVYVYKKKKNKLKRPTSVVNSNQYYDVGLGFRISFPVSSQDILKSLRTCRVRDVKICGAITNLWMPITKRDTANGKESTKFRLMLIFCTLLTQHGFDTYTKQMLLWQICNDLIRIQLMVQRLF